MPLNLPIASSGPRAPDKQQPRPVPKQIKAVIKLMIYGSPDDPDGRPIDFITAAKACGVRPDNMRKWLDRSEVRAFLRAERAVYRQVICSGNDYALRRIRDGENAMAAVRATQVLEELSQDEAGRSARGAQMPGLIVQIITPPAAPTSAHVIDSEPIPAPDAMQPPVAEELPTAPPIGSRPYRAPPGMQAAPRQPFLDD
jgi:hypothetical protein